MAVSWQNNVTLYQLRIFLAVTRHRNYTHAAEELYLSQPSVSAQVHELERLIGLPLFEQVGKRLVLTQAGEMLKAHALNVFAAVEQAANALARLRQVDAGRLHVVANPTVGAYLLPKVLGIFRARYPHVELVLELKNTEDICDEVRIGYVELGVIETTGEILTDDLVFTPYRDDELLLIVPAWHPWAGMETVPIQALTQVTLLWREPGSGLRRMMEQVLHEAGVQAQVSIQFDSTEAIKQAVAANIGVSLVSQYSVSAEVAAGWLATVRIAEVELRRQFQIVQRRNSVLSPAAAAFLKLLSGE